MNYEQRKPVPSTGRLGVLVVGMGSLATTLIAGVLAVLVNLVLNTVITGAPFKAAYQILIDQEADDDGDDATTVPGTLGTLLLPMGIPRCRTRRSS